MKTYTEIEKLADEVYPYTDMGKLKSHIGFINGYTKCQEDMSNNFLSLIEEYREKELPNKDVPYHYEAEIDSGLKYLIMFIKNKQE